MTDPKIDLKTPWIAGVLAYLIPGAGHLYQRRFFKAILYFVCVFGTFLYGMSLGDWKVVYWTENPGRERFGQPWKKNYGFLTQLGIGCPSLFAFLQERRYRTPDNRPAFFNRGGINDRSPLTSPLDSEFTGDLVEPLDPHDLNNGGAKFTRVSGHIHLEPHNRIFKGTFKGTIENEDNTTRPFECELGGTLYVDSKILGDKERDVAAGVIGENGEYQGNELRGTVPREFSNWFEAPLDAATLQDVNGRLTKQFEMALVYTWIAGLLNILVIWDAVQGPAYGYDDEHYRQSQKSDDKLKPETKSQTAAVSVDAGTDPANAGVSGEQQDADARPAPEAAGNTVES